MRTSESERFNSANKCAFSVRVRPRAAEIWAATRFHARGVFKAQNNASSVCCATRVGLESSPIALTSLKSAAYSGLLRPSGGGKRNCDGRLSTHGVMVAICGVAPKALAGGVGRQKPTADVPATPCTPMNGGGAGTNPSVSLVVQMASATVWPQATPAAIACGFSVNASAASEASRRAVSVPVCAGYSFKRIA